MSKTKSKRENVIEKVLEEAVELESDFNIDVKDLGPNCASCKNNVEYPPPHTCDVCTSLDEEEYSMWESK